MYTNICKVVLVMVVPVAVSCSFLKREEISPPLPGIGYQCLPVPSEMNRAGSVIFVTDGIPFQLGMVDGLKVEDSKVAVPSYKSESIIKAGFFLKTLESFTSRKGWAANVGAETGETINVKTSYGGKPNLNYLTGQPESDAIKWFKEKGYKVEAKSRYYLVREAIQSKEVVYEISKNDFSRIGGAVTTKILEGQVNLINDNSSEAYELRAVLDSPVNVCIKLRELVVTGSSSNGDQYLGFRDVQGSVLTGR